jgi:hypothetical protein
VAADIESTPRRMADMGRMLLQCLLARPAIATYVCSGV